MPNWCNNTVEISHPDTAKMQALVEAANAGKFCNFAVPTPEDLNITAGFLGEGDKQRELEAKEQSNLEKYGYKNWYDFQIANWGTKWDVDCYDTVVLEGNTAKFGFDSAWAPPIGVYAALEEQGFTVKAFYYEMGMCFAGKWFEGEDDYYEFSDMTADELEKEIDPELNEAMCITENMREWEEENSED